MNVLPLIDLDQALADCRRQLFENSTSAIHEIDTRGVIRAVNRAECMLLGYEAHELIDHYIWEFLPAELREICRSGIAQKIARERPLAVFSREFRRADGTYLWVEIHESLIEDDGEVLGIRSALFDITNRREAEMEVQRQHDRMKYLLQSWTRAIVTADPLGHVDFMNAAAESLTGWTQSEAFGQPIESICRVSEESGEPVGVMSCILDGNPVNPTRQSLFIDRAGARCRVAWVASSIRNDNAVIIGAAIAMEKCLAEG